MAWHLRRLLATWWSLKPVIAKENDQLMGTWWPRSFRLHWSTGTRRDIVGTRQMGYEEKKLLYPKNISEWNAIARKAFSARGTRTIHAEMGAKWIFNTSVHERAEQRQHWTSQVNIWTRVHQANLNDFSRIILHTQVSILFQLSTAPNVGSFFERQHSK